MVTSDGTRGPRRPAPTPIALIAGPPPDRAGESVRTLCSGSLCPGCNRPFTPTRRNQRHCRPAAFSRKPIVGS